MIYSAYQNALFSHIENQNNSVIINAVAGSGKTSTIVEACNRLPKKSSVLFLAFNLKIVEELRTRLPSRVKCRTFNSIGWATWIRSVGNKPITLDKDKVQKIINKRFTKEDQEIYGSFVFKMISLAKSSGLRVSDPDFEWMRIQEHHDLQLTKGSDYVRALDLSRKTLAVSNNTAHMVCDFNDQLYMPWHENINFDKYDEVFVDELQDTNPIQTNILKRLLRPSSRLIGVGDKRQAIYGFRGAEVDSMNQIQESFNAVSLPLSISYRCCKAVIREAQKYVPEIESYEKSEEGVVETLDNYNVNTFQPEDAIICRNTAPLIEMAYGLITRGKPVNFLGRDIGEDLKSLILNMEANNLDELSNYLTAWFEKESNRLKTKDQGDKASALSDKIKCIETFIKYLPRTNQTIDGLLTAVDSLFNSSNSGVTLCTVHKSKGAEWNRVFILDFKLMPSSWAKQDWQVAQENNLIYVAITRAKSYLGYIVSKRWSDEPNLINIFTDISSSSHIENSKTNVRKTRVKKIGTFNPFK